MEHGDVDAQLLDTQFSSGNVPLKVGKGDLCHGGSH
jgi:hypothetical protein